MPNRAFVFLQMSFSPKANSAGVTPKWPFKIMDIDVQPQLGGFGEYFVADATHALTFLVHLQC